MKKRIHKGLKINYVSINCTLLEYKWNSGRHTTETNKIIIYFALYFLSTLNLLFPIFVNVIFIGFFPSFSLHLEGIKWHCTHQEISRCWVALFILYSNTIKYIIKFFLWLRIEDKYRRFISIWTTTQQIELDFLVNIQLN